MTHGTILDVPTLHLFLCENIKLLGATEDLEAGHENTLVEN